ncbi:glycogen/starch/alpha-glucan phosphorylase [Sideroxydans lithotrophicus]|uniref:Alpha-1,4 glucan phosphorylase n=1 Tax=Sideroxydans lithotrophicus (strain ES-1) TaxID=580332 RepID=D5CQ54_SIDLE|nr:glycogen/starch/alpha-glucan phosphorylase [Sideroxydans lithotrophicus ES-1]
MNNKATPQHRNAGMSKEAVEVSLGDHLIYTSSKYHTDATTHDWFQITALTVRDRLVERWMETMQRYYEQDVKRTYYLSLEFLMGRTLGNAMLNLGMEEQCKAALYELGQELEVVAEVEADAALGNGGLGRLAACILDSMATLDLPCYGYGIRYEYGMFRQSIENGIQMEHPDNWLRYGNPWEFPRPELLYPVKFYGRVVEYRHENGLLHHHWVDTDDVMAMAYDTPVPGYGGKTVNNMRLWAAKSSRDFDLRYFNQGNYIQAVADKNESENLSKVLYPNDTTEMGRELRLKQQYFFVSASLQDMLFRYKKKHSNWVQLPDKVAVQLNDTHPSIAIAEMMRLMVDVHHQTWEEAWELTTRIFSYTNHTLMPEALETWPVAMLESVLPRHLQIIYEINHRFLQQVMHQFPGDGELLQRLSIIDESGGRRVRMSHLAIIGSHAVNGVAALHTELIKRTIFADFERVMPGKIINITNGVTPRRWLNQANPGLSRLITEYVGDVWLTDLDQLKRLREFADNEVFQQQFRAVKQANKARLAGMIRKQLGIEIDPSSIFDIQIKRIHEYKRQLLNMLHVITLYNRIRSGNHPDVMPRTVIIAGKAAPGYTMAKRIIRLVNDVAEVVNNDQLIDGKLKLVFMPNYDVSNAERIVPAADLSEQISTAGTEASGTGNMKLALNGALTICTLDGANVEMGDEVGTENLFMFGLSAAEVDLLRRQGYDPLSYYNGNGELKQALDMIATGYFCPDEPNRYQEISDALLKNGDHFMLLADYAAYIACQDKVNELYRDPKEWTRRAILNVAGMGKFSCDRTVREYAERVWHVAPIEPMASEST